MAPEFRTASEAELFILFDALNEYAVQLRTMPQPSGTDRVLSEAHFLSLDISEGRRTRYLRTRDMLQSVTTLLRSTGSMGGPSTSTLYPTVSNRS